MLQSLFLEANFGCEGPVELLVRHTSLIIWGIWGIKIIGKSGELIGHHIQQAEINGREFYTLCTFELINVTKTETLLIKRDGY